MRINLGSGQRRFKDFVNVDISDKFSPDIQLDSETYLKLQAGDSVDMIVCHHTIEHSGCGESDGLLRECHRVLKPMHPVLVFVPDMEKLAHMWLEGRMTDQLYFTNVYGAYQGEEPDRHRWGFTERSLKSTLAQTGFFPKLFDWRTILGADIARDDRWILGVEGIKV